MKEEKEQYELIVTQGKRPFWMRLLAACLFTLVLLDLFFIVFSFYKIGFNETMKSMAGDIKIIGYSLAGGIYFSMTKNILIDTNKDVLISRYCVGPFSRDVISKVPDLEYVSVFLDAKENYQVNLWYVGNKHYQMYFFEKKEAAIEFAKQTALKLKIDLLDATVKGDSVWIDLPKA